jgi:DNA polymerase-3 subunit delta'
LANSHPDVVRVDPDDKGNIAIDAIRVLTSRLALKAAEASHKVAYIRDADLMNPAAQNALLKTLEEPPGASCFILTTTRWRTLLPTVRSRSLTLRLAPLAREGAAQTLCAQGLPEAHAQPLAALVGPDLDRAQAMLANGLDEILATLTAALGSDCSVDTILKTAAELGAERDRADLAMTLIEVGIRDALAQRHGAPAAHLYVQPLWLSAHAERHPERLAAAGLRIQQLRRARAMNPNRTLGLEGILLLLAGKLGTERIASTGSSRFA